MVDQSVSSDHGSFLCFMNAHEMLLW